MSDTWQPAEADLPPHPEEARSFDIMASVRMYRYDFAHFGRVLPETRGRVHDEELSRMVEGVNRAACTVFGLRREGDDLTYYRDGSWRSYTGMLLVGRDVAVKEAEQDPRRQFLADNAVSDLEHLYHMRKLLQPGEQHVWVSSYRHDIEKRYGADFMKECGHFPDRQLGFIYRAYCNQEGDVILESQTVDRSNDEAFAAVMERAAHDPTAGMYSLVDAYDGVLRRDLGGEFFAGRRGAEVNENAWQTLLQQRDLIAFFLAKLESIAASPLEGDELEEAVKRHVYGSWAAFKQRIDGVTHAPITQDGLSVVGYLMAEQEVERAFARFAAQGAVMIGCGGAISILMGETDILNASSKDVFEAIFGPGEEDEFGPLVFTCKHGHVNRRKRGNLREECRAITCSKGSVGCGPK